MDRFMLITNVLNWIFVAFCFVVIIVAAIAVQMLSNYTLNVAKYLVYPFAGVVKPILVGIEFLKDLTDGIGEPPDIIKKLGGFRLILFMIAVLTATISMIKEITMTADLHTLLEIVLLNTSVGGLMAIFEGVEISITVCMDILLFSIFTGWFVSHCLKLSLPIQLLYDSLFILFIALVLEKLPEFRYSFISREWWAMLKYDLPELTTGISEGNVFLAVMEDLLPMWNTLLNRLLLFISLIVGVVFIIAAIGNVASSFLCGVISVILLSLVSYGANPWLEIIPESIAMILVLIVIVLIELFIFNLGRFIPEDFAGEHISMLEAIDELDGNFMKSLICFAGYFGIPVLGLTFVCASILIFDRPSDGTEFILICNTVSILFLSFLACCLPGMIWAVFDSGRLSAAWKVIISVVKTIPWMLIFYAVQALVIGGLGKLFKIT